MKTNPLSIGIFLVIIGILALLMINLAPQHPTTSSPLFATVGNVRGMAIIHKGMPYTLNFKQQEFSIDNLNRAVKVKKSDFVSSKDSFLFEKLVIYRFEGEEIEVVPVALNEKNIVFSSPTLSSDSYFLELSGGELYTLLSKAFDP
jgi:hypothetical protein